MLVHIGREPGSKPYMMLYLETRKIVVSMDVMIVESKAWKWKRHKTEPESDRYFVVTLGDIRNYGIQNSIEDVENDQLKEGVIKLTTRSSVLRKRARHRLDMI